MEKTSCRSYFAICSAGDIQNGVGFVAAENSFFDPDEITKMLEMQPYNTTLMGAPRGNGHGFFPFSFWCACEQTEPAIDAEEQCLKIVRELSPKIPILNKIYEQYNVDFAIEVVPKVFHEQAPILCFNREIIDFCYLTKSEIDIDLYVFNEE